jgi:hypothetical protein
MMGRGTNVGGNSRGGNKSSATGVAGRNTKSLLDTHWTGTDVKVEYDEDRRSSIQSHFQQLFKKQLTDKEVAELVGAPDGSKVHVTADYDGNLKIQTSHKYFDHEQERLFALEDSYDRQGSIVLRRVAHNEFFALNDAAPEGLGTHIFAQQVKALKKYGFEEITAVVGEGYYTRADGSQGVFSGGYAWPRLGYNRDLHPQEIRSLKADEASGKIDFSANQVKSLNDVMLQGKSGADWWRRNAEGGEMSFNLKKNSISSQVLSNYLKYRKINIDIE